MNTRRRTVVNTSRPIGIDLFAGVGGMSLGFEQAGFDVAAAVEIDPIHSCAHAFNFPRTAIVPKSVVALSATEIRERAGLGNAVVHTVFGGAPCQGFSLIGHRALDDPRNRLVGEFLRLVLELEAQSFVFENVKGLTVGRHRAFLEELIDEFEKSGFAVRQPWQILNAASYGAPQDRERLILIGVRKGMEVPLYPPPTHRPPWEPPSLFALPPTPTCQEALDDLPDPETFDELFSDDSVRCSQHGRRSAFANEMAVVAADHWHYGHPRNWDRCSLTASMRTDHSEISRKRFARTEQGQVEPISRFYKLPADGVSNTLRAGTDAARGAFTSPRPIHYRHARCVTVREMARLHGFPDWFRFHRTKWHGARQIGNAVAPPMARAVAAALLPALGFAPSRPTASLELGDPMLLTLDMSEAANHWGIAIPIGRRDRKSGARKRKQQEIEALAV